ncbi:MAG: M48 family metalloprotease [Candidatus Helarchaeota archaeon]|nr:M48 family metalloprotease [Candidatus Helarchaeota archaeon]
MDKLRNTFKAVLGGIGSLLFVLFILLMWSAQIKSCFITGSINNKSGLSNDMKIIKASPYNLKHRMIIERLTNIYASLNLATQEKWTANFINDKSSLNAASFGNGMYLFWETLTDLPDWAIDSILAHEVAHDLLLHSRKMSDVDDVRSFFTEVLSLIGGADRGTESTLQEWSSKLTLPKYSKKQEYEADEKAVKILSICGYEKSELIFANTLKYVRNCYGDSGGGFFDYHPSTEERIKKVLSLRP